jgi:hypothetical protein
MAAMDAAGGKLGWKAFGGATGMLAGLVTKKLLTLAWTKVTGREPPDNPEHPHVRLSEALGWVTLSGLAVAVARLLAVRKAAEAWERASGSLPPGLEEG